MVSSPRNSAWRKDWRANMPRADNKRPTDAMLAAAESTFMDPECSAIDRKFAALKGVPTPVSNESCFPMWIPAKALTATFSDTEIMTSLGSGQQPATWSSSIVHMRDFKCIKNGGISFVCTDREICTKLGSLKVTICGREFMVQPYSKYSHWYYVDLHRLQDDVTDGDIYDWFVNQGTPPVYLTPAQEANGLKSRTRRVYFNQKAPPASLMIGGKLPLRQIQFTGSGYCVVNHRLRAYNKEVPPFLAEQRGPTRSSRKEGTPPNPRTRPEIDLSANSTTPSDPPEQAAAGNKPPIPDGDDSMGGSSDASEPPDEEAASVVRVRPEAIWTQAGSPPTFKLPETESLATVHGRLTHCKRLLFPGAAPPTLDPIPLPPSQTDYPEIASHNAYEWLATGEDTDPIPPDQDFVLLDSTSVPPVPVASTVSGSETANLLAQTCLPSFNVNEMTLDELQKVLDAYIQDFTSDENPDTCLTRIQAQPTFLRPLFDSGAPENYLFLRAKIFGHAVLRALGQQETQNEPATLHDRLKDLFPSAGTLDYQQILQVIFSENVGEIWRQVYIAELDLCLQILAPSIYTDPFKVCALIHSTASALPFTPFHLWGDTTLLRLLRSPLLERIGAAQLPSDLRQSLEALQTLTAMDTTMESPSASL